MNPMKTCCTLGLFLCLSTVAMAQADQNPPAETEQLTQMPQLMEHIEADYPAQAQEQGIEGAVVMVITVDETGLVTDVQVKEPAGHGFDEAAVAAAWKFRFQPAMAGETPVPVAITYTYRFVLKPEVQPVTPPAQTADTPLPKEPEKEKPINFTGQLRERGTRKPLETVEVSLLELEQTQLTDADGRFSFRGVPAGQLTVVYTLMGYEVVQNKVKFKEGELTEVVSYLEKLTYNDYHLTVRAKRPETVITRRVLEQHEIKRIPGTQGDTIKVVSVLPGVARTPMGLGGLLIFRGADDSSSSVQVDGTSLMHLFHFGGLRSIINSELVESIDFFPGNMGVYYGETIGGMIDVKTRAPKDDRLHFTLDVNAFEGGFLVEGPLTENLSFVAAAHRNWHDLVLGAVWPDDADADFTAAPVYYDYQFKLHYKGFENHQIELFSLGADDQMRLLLGNDEEAGMAFKDHELFHTIYLQDVYKPSDTLKNTALLSFSYQNNKATFFTAGYVDVKFSVVHFRDALEWQFSKKYKLHAGIDSYYAHGDLYFSAPHFGRDGEDQNDSRMNATTRKTDDAFDTVMLASYLELIARPFKNFQVVPGVRFNYTDYNTNFNLTGSLSARYSLAEWTTIKAAAGHYSKMPWGPMISKGYGNPDLAAETSTQFSVGIEQNITDLLNVDLTVFYSESDDLVVSNPALRTDPNAIPYLNLGLAHSIGMELMIKHQPSEYFSGWLSYTLSRAERKFPGEEWELFQFDQTHILSAVGMFNLPSNWSIGFRFRLISGNPEKRYQEQSGFNADSGEYIPVTSNMKHGRSPLTHSLDIRVDKTYVFDRWMLSIYLDVQNVYNHRNSEFLIWNFDYTESQYVKGLPILPTLGLKVEF